MNFRYKNSAIAMASFYDLAAKRLDGEMIKMGQGGAGGEHSILVRHHRQRLYADE